MLRLGSVVSVSFGKKKDQIGIVYELCGNKIKKIHFIFTIKEIDHVYEGVFLYKKIIKFIDWIADYTLAPKGLVLKLFLVNKNIIGHQIKDHEESIFNPRACCT